MLISNWLSRHAQAVSSVPVKFRRDRRRPQVQQCFRPSDLTRQVDVLEDRTLLAADFGDAPTGYPVTQAENGAEHAASGPMLGATRDMETDGTHSASADADGADEDGVVETGDFIVVGQTGAGVTVNVQNASGGALLDAWMDFNADGDWDDAGEQIFTSTSVENGDNALTFDVPGTAVVGITYARLRLSTAGGLSVTGSAADGEVEDYEIEISAQADFGDAPASYPVTRSENGAEHAASGPMLGATRDMETDGTHSASADADGADEDGVVETGDFIVVGQTGAGVTVNVQNASGGALLDAWMDFNADGDWDDAGEQIFTSTSVENGDNALTFDVPGTAVVGITYARLRLSTAGGLSVTGSAADGEVEDYEIEISAQADFGDAPASYPVTRSDNGAEHAASGPMLGATRDMETDGTHSASADADGADEDGVLETGDYIVAGQTASSVTVNVQNASSGALLDAWMDFNADGDWEDAGEQIFASTLVVNGDNALTFNVPSTAVVGTTYARLRLSTAGGLGVTGSAADGEVEDYEIEISAQADFGDAPAPYPVTRSEMGAQHLPTGPTLGPLRDAEIDGTHSTMADADGADEDGVLETGDDLVAGETGLSVTINVQNAPSGALLDAWMDFNADGDWDDAGEQIFSSASVVNGDNPLTMDVPADAAPGITYARLRLSTAGGLGVTGTADDGEVEDYEIEITAAETAPEGETGSFPVVFSDPEIGASKTFVLTGGADDDQFVIDAGTGVLQFANAPDFENPADDGGDNVYEVRVVVVDSELHTAAQDIQITVTDLNDDPVFVAVPDTISDGATQVGMVVAMDEDLPAQAVLYGIDGGADAGLFSIDSMTGVLSFTSAPDYASPADDNGDGVYEVVVEADDQAGGVSTQAVQVTVLPPFTFNSMTGALTVPVVTGELTLKSTGSTGEVVINDIPVGVAVTSVTAILVQGTAGGDFIELEEIDEVNMPALTSAIQVDAGDGDDSILGSALGDLILAGDGDDFVFADDGANTLFGGAGDDVLLGGQDVDSMDGGEGGDFLLGMAGDDVMTGGPGNDSLLGAAGSDNLSGDAGDDHLRGMGASGDVLSGGAGTDELSGGAGTDQLLEVFSTAADIRLSDTELEVDGTIEQATGFEQAAVTAGDGGVSINTQNFSGSASLTGGAGPDSILSGDGNDILFGLAGNDVLSAGAGDDLLFGSSGRDRLNGGPGDDVVKGQGTSGDTVEGGAGSDLLDGGSGGDRLYEFFVNALNIGVSDSQLVTDGETDILLNLEQLEIHTGDLGVTIDALLFTGSTILFGGAGDDRFFTAGGNDQLFGFGGNDILDSGDGDDFLLGSAGRDTLRGGSGDDVLRGQGGSGDRLIGGPGADFMDGGAGADILTTGGADTVVPDSSDIIIAELNATFAVSDDWIDNV